nr:putative ribonuclease H-like domain-containing protein [Tanacetum cinerariifolium]
LTSHLNIIKKIFKYLKGQPNLGLWYPQDFPFQLEAYSDSDYAGSDGNRKSTTGGCYFIGRRLISWQCNKQTVVATSSTKAEYVAAASCCGQLLVHADEFIPDGRCTITTVSFSFFMLDWLLLAGPSDIIATIDGNEVVVTESLIRTQLQLDDVNGLYEFTLHDVLDGMRAIGNLVPATRVLAGSIVSTGGVPAGSVPASGVPTGGVFASSVPADGVLAGSIVSTGGVPASDVPASGVPAGSVPASSVPAGRVLAGSIVFAEFGDPAASAFVPAVFTNAPAATSPLPPGHSLLSYEHTTRFLSLTDLGNHQPSAAIFSSSSYDDDFCADVTNLASNVVVDPVTTKRVNIIHPQS